MIYDTKSTYEAAASALFRRRRRRDRAQVFQFLSVVRQAHADLR